MNKTFWGLTSIFSLLLCIACSPASNNNRTSSRDFPISDFQYQHSLDSTIGIVSPNLRPSGDHYFACAGVVISVNYVLTAEHCVDNDIHTMFGTIPGPTPIGDIEQLISYAMFVNTGFSSTVDYEVVAVDGPRDLALLRRVDKDRLLGVTISNLAPGVENSRVGDLVYAIGHPVGVTFNVSSGYVSRPIIHLTGSGDDGESVGDRVLTNAQVYMGNSGGPLFDWQGRVLGIISQIAGGQPYLNRAVYITTIREFLRELNLEELTVE